MHWENLSSCSFKMKKMIFLLQQKGRESDKIAEFPEFRVLKSIILRPCRTLFECEPKNKTFSMSHCIKNVFRGY